MRSRAILVWAPSHMSRVGERRRPVMRRTFGSSAVLTGTRFVGVVAFVALMASAAVRAADLTSSEKQYLDGANKYLTQLQANMKLATDAAGPGEETPSPAKAKLAAARLQSAQQSAANVAARLEKL